MPGGWEGSNRRDELPADWPRLRYIVITRAGGRCEETMRNGTRCRDKATDCDHVDGKDDHSIANLRALCSWHHKKKTSAQGNAARKRPTMKRPKQKHPGLL